MIKIINYICIRSHFLISLRQFFTETTYREVPEWLKGHAWKACIPVTVSRVRIPSSLRMYQNSFPTQPTCSEPVTQFLFILTRFVSKCTL